MHCTNCTRELVTINLTIASERVAFHRCARCDTRTWVRADDEITRDGVLELVRASR